MNYMDGHIENVKEVTKTKLRVLVIYDICDNKKRQKLAKLLEGYGFRVQKSAFESRLSQTKYKHLLKALEPFCTEGKESIRVYKFFSDAQITTYGQSTETEVEDVLFL